MVAGLCACAAAHEIHTFEGGCGRFSERAGSSGLCHSCVRGKHDPCQRSATSFGAAQAITACPDCGWSVAHHYGFVG